MTKSALAHSKNIYLFCGTETCVLPKPSHAIMLEEASLELVPEKFQRNKSCDLVKRRFGISPQTQILDDNYHHEIVAKFPNREKRGRPDIVHFALLDIVSTPAYIEGLVDVYVHTINNTTIKLKNGVRLPRTFERFCGVMAKVLSEDMGSDEKEHFDVKRSETIDHVLTEINSDCNVCLTTEGKPVELHVFVKELTSSKKRITWMIGGFSHGHFSDMPKSLSSNIISISEHALAAHVVTARLCSEIERVTFAR